MRGERGGFTLVVLFAAIFIFIFSAGIISADFCYQESATVYNQVGTDGNCGLIYNGNYALDGYLVYRIPNTLILIDAFQNISDGDWNTYAFGNPQASIFINYTKPIGALVSSLWKVRDSGDNPEFYGNISIPGDCWNNGNILQFMIKEGDSGNNYMRYYCYNGNSWELLQNDVRNDHFYEDAMLWDIPSYFSSQPQTFWNLTGNSIYPSSLDYNVGIGTSAPSKALEVVGDILASGDICISSGNCLSKIMGMNYTNLALLNVANTFLENQIFNKDITVKGNGNFSGTVYMNGQDLSASLPKITKTVSDRQTSGRNLVNVTGLNFNVVAGNTYYFRFVIPFKTSFKSNGLKLSLDSPKSDVYSAKVYLPVQSDGTEGELHGWLTSPNDFVLGKGVQSANTDYIATIEGVISPTSSGVIQVKFGSEMGNTVTVRKGAIGFLYKE